MKPASFPLTPALSPSAGERENLSQRSGKIGRLENSATFLPEQSQPGKRKAGVEISSERDFALPLLGERAGVRADVHRKSTALELPRISKPLLRWFTWYSRRYIHRHFHSLRISLAGLPPDTQGRPLVIYSNHASWWDVLVCLVLKDEFFPGSNLFAPIDAEALENYKMFRRLGFFGVERGSRRGAVHFLRTAEAILKSPSPLLFITPQSRFADVRARPIRFESGLGHLAARVEDALFVPVVGEYVFWEERLPEILVRFGEPVMVDQPLAHQFGSEAWTNLFERKLEAAQDALAAEVKLRQPGKFQTILSGAAGQGGVYDWWRALTAKLRGENFRKEHGRK